MTDSDTQALMDLGFTELEARVYLCLLMESPLTGYAVAKSIGKPAANTYKAIEGLSRKAAVIVEEGENRMCRAAPPDEVLGSLERTFGKRRDQARQAMERLHSPGDDPRVYQLTDVDQVFDRCRSMLRQATTIAMLDALPAPLERLGEDLVAAADRGVLVCARVYRPVSLQGVQVRDEPMSSPQLADWPGNHLSLAVDAEQHLYALLSKDVQTVHQAIWSESLYLSCMAHNHLALEFEFAEMRLKQHIGLNDMPIHLVRDRLPGFERLRHRHSTALGGDSG